MSQAGPEVSNMSLWQRNYTSQIPPRVQFGTTQSSGVWLNYPSQNRPVERGDSTGASSPYITVLLSMYSVFVDPYSC